jgi:hypothetical protein
MYVNLRFFVNAVSSVGTANTEEEVILRSQERSDMAFTLTAVFSAD